MSAPAGQDYAALAVLADRQAALAQRVTGNAAGIVARLWRAFTGWYSPGQVRVVTRRSGGILASAQKRSGQHTQAYLERVLQLLDAAPDEPPVLELPDEPRGIPREEEFARVAEQYRYLRSVDTPEPDAVSQAVTRAEVVTSEGTHLARREASRQVLAAADKVTGYRRVIHPELSAGGTCGLCIAASDRIYHKSQLLPVHARCKCQTMPIVGEADPGRSLNQGDLSRLYSEAGGTAGAKLKRTRYRVVEHSELGPQLLGADESDRLAA